MGCWMEGREPREVHESSKRRHGQGMERIQKWPGMVQKEKWAWGMVGVDRFCYREAIEHEGGTIEGVGWENHGGGR